MDSDKAVHRPGCTCGGNFGERGADHIAVVSQDYDGNYIIDLNASNAQ